MGIVKQGISTEEKNTTAEITAGVAASKAVALGGSGADGAKTVSSSENLTPDTWYEYTTLTINSGQTLGLSAAGRMLLRCTEKVTINGIISVSEKGRQGQSTAGSGENNGGLSSGGGGGGGGNANDGTTGGGSTDTGCGAGGGLGATGANNGGAGATIAVLTDLEYLINSPAKLVFNGGSSGGRGGHSGNNDGGHGGGVLLLIAPEVEIASGGSIVANGESKGIGDANCGGGGGGAGGSILIITKKFTNNGSVTVTKGSGGTGSGTGNTGDGGDGGDGNYKVILV